MYRKVFKKKGIKYRAVGFLPAKADIEKQKEFLETTMKPLIKRAKEGVIELFFMDASHFVMGGFLGKVWSKLRKYVKTSSGRKRFNVLGALNFVSHKMEFVANDTYITSVQVVELLEKISKKYCGKIIKIVLDNASYQRCRFVEEHAKRLGIELVFLPPYSPNLNLIERVWKFVKSRVLTAAYFLTFSDFQNVILNLLISLQRKFSCEMNSLISENFQLFDKVSFIS